MSRAGATTVTASFFDNDGTAEYRLPFEAKAGVAYRFARGQIEFDVQMNTGAGVYDGFASDGHTTILTDTGTGVVTAEEVPAVPEVIDSRGW